jgi:hypothetical protein
MLISKQLLIILSIKLYPFKSETLGHLNAGQMHLQGASFGDVPPVAVCREPCREDELITERVIKMKRGI